MERALRIMINWIKGKNITRIQLDTRATSDTELRRMKDEGEAGKGE